MCSKFHDSLLMDFNSLGRELPNFLISLYSPCPQVHVLERLKELVFAMQSSQV